MFLFESSVQISTLSRVGILSHVMTYPKSDTCILFLSLLVADIAIKLYYSREEK